MSWLIPGIMRHTFMFEPVAFILYNFATALIPVVLSHYGMAVLVQLPGTCFYRVALLPVVFWSTMRANSLLDLSFGSPGHAYLNQEFALGMFTIAMRSMAWAFVSMPYTRYPLHKLSEETTNGHHDDTTTTDTGSLRSAIWNAFDLTVNLRGIGWNWQGRTHIPKPYFQITSRPIFLIHTLLRLSFFTVTFDTFSAFIRSLGPTTFGTPNGGTIFDPTFPLFKRYFRSSLVTLLSGTSAYLVIDVVYQLHALFFTLLLGQHPTQWPPLFDNPWFATSLTDFWGRRWHQLFREYFVAVGGSMFGMRRFLGRPGMVLGAFTISGFLHDVGMRGMRRGADTFPVVGFFVLQGVGIVLKGIWKRVAWRRVGGWMGWVWMTLWMVGWGSVVVDVKGRRGLLGSEFCPEAYRPGKVVLRWLGLGV